MFLPIRSKNPPESFPAATIILIVINIVAFACTSQGLEIKEQVLKNWGLTYGGFSPLHVLSSMFLHGDIFHLLGNLWFLYLLGFAVEGRLKTLKFSVLYLVAGTTGALLHTFVFGASAPDTPMIGASGAIMGVMGAALYLFPFSQMDIFVWWGFFLRILNWPMWGVALYYLGFDLVLAFLFAGGDGVAHLAHLGGAAGGALVCLVFRAKRDNAEASEAKATYADTKDLSYLNSRELEAMHKSNQTDTTIILNWMQRSFRDPYGVRPECHHAFMNALPRIVQEQSAQSVGMVFSQMGTSPGLIPAKYLMDCGYKLERAGEYTMSLRMFESVVRDTNASISDWESSMFRMAMLSETAFNNYQRAVFTYGEIVKRSPMSPIADQAKARQKALIERHGTGVV